MNSRFINETDFSVELMYNQKQFTIPAQSFLDVEFKSSVVSCEIYVNKKSKRKWHVLYLNCKSDYEIKIDRENAVFYINDFSIENDRCITYSGLTLRSNDITILSKTISVLDKDVIKQSAEKFAEFDKKGEKILGAYDMMLVIKSWIVLIFIFVFIFVKVSKIAGIINAVYVITVLILIAVCTILPIKLILNKINKKLDKELGDDVVNVKPRDLNTYFDENYITNMIYFDQ